MLLLLYLLLIDFVVFSTKAHPHRAGTCDAGNFGLDRFHGGKRQTLQNRNLSLKVNGETMYPNNSFEVSQGSHNLTLTNTDGVTEFKGFFFRLQNTNGADTSNMLLETSHFARINPLCTQNATGIEHTSNSLKTSITVTFSPRLVGEYILDLHVVATRENDWVYDQYSITVVSSNLSSTVSPSDASLSQNGGEIRFDKKEVRLIVAFSILGLYLFLSLFCFCWKIIRRPYNHTKKTPMEQEEPKMSWLPAEIQLTPLIV